MNAEQIARDYRLNGASFTKLRLIRAADDMAQAVLDAAEYRKRAVIGRTSFAPSESASAWRCCE